MRPRRLNNRYNSAEEAALIQRAQSGDKKAVEALLARHDPLARHYANRYLGVFGTQEFDDVLQTCRIAIFQAILRFDPTRGTRFSTVATWAIRGEISRLRRSDAIIRIPQHIMDRPRLPEGQSLPHCAYSLDEFLPANENGNGSDRHIDWIIAHDNPEAILCNQLDPAIQRAIDALPNRLREALARRYGFDGHHESTLEEIGAFLGVSKEAARNYVNRALNQLRAALNVEVVP